MIQSNFKISVALALGPAAFAVGLLCAGPSLAVTCGAALSGAETSAHAFALRSGELIVDDQVTRSSAGAISNGDYFAGGPNLIDTLAYAHTGSAGQTAHVAAFTRHKKGDRLTPFDNRSDIEAGLEADYIACTGNSLAGDVLSLSNYSLDFAYRVALRAPDTATVVTPFNLHGGRGEAFAAAAVDGSAKLWSTNGETEGISETDIVNTHPLFSGLIAEYSMPNPAFTPLDLHAEILITVDNTFSIGAVPRSLMMRLSNDTYIEDFITGPVEVEQQLVLLGARTDHVVPAGAGLLFESGLFLPLIGEQSGLPSGGNAAAVSLPGGSSTLFANGPDALLGVIPAPPAALLLLAGIIGTRIRRA